MKNKILYTLFFVHTILHPFIVKYSSTLQDDGKAIVISVPVTLEPHELIDEKHILISANSPDITITNWVIDKKPIASYSPHHQNHVLVYEQSFIITIFVKKLDSFNQTNTPTLHLTLSSSTYPDPEEIIIPINFSSNITSTSTLFSDEQIQKTTPQKSLSKTSVSFNLADKITSLKDGIKKILTETDSIFVRLILAFLLGLLLSLTPCIYPMIPITLGVLQSQNQTSFFRNLFIALCYTVGLSITFSLMGLLAASSGQAFGYLMANPLFVIIIVCFLCYFAFSLFGFYDLYIPRFLQQKGSVSKSGSAVSAFLFGMASGSVASPCVSPGLALILTIVATLGNSFLGFLLLFAFGFGISTPLLILGTFSGSISMLPRAGMWMLEIQKIFGFMLLGMSIYYLNAIIPFFITMALIALLCLIMGIHYFSNITETDSTFYKILKNGIGLLAIVAAVMSGIQSFEAWYHPAPKISFESTWYTNYQEALQQAQKEQKLVFIDTWTPYCSICKGITNKLLKSNPISAVLKENYIILSVDASDAYTEPYATIKEKFHVTGVPYLIVIDPHTEKEIKHWQSEMYDMTIPELEQVLLELKNRT